MQYLYKEERPWGRFFVISEEQNFKIKKIEVEPNKRLSYQFHNKRSEYWIVIQGEGLRVLNDINSKVKNLNEKKDKISRIIIKPNNEEMELHKKYLKSSLVKNYYK